MYWRRILLSVFFVLVSVSSASMFPLEDPQVSLWKDENGLVRRMCGYPIYLYVSPKLSTRMKENVRTAYLMWNKLLSANVFIELDRKLNIPNMVSFVKVFAGDYLALVNPSDKNGCFSSTDINVVVSKLAEYDDFVIARAMAHELGHLLGLDHVDEISGLMYPKLPRSATTFGTVSVQSIRVIKEMFLLYGESYKRRSFGGFNEE